MRARPDDPALRPPVAGPPPTALPPARPGRGVPLAELTTLGLGGPAEALTVAEDEAALVAAVRAADAAGRPLLLVAGGSNLVIGDGPVAGEVVVVRTRGVEDASDPEDPERLLRTVAAGEPWDAVVAGAVADGLAGIECLSGIPGCAGATPIQNVGAYGQEVADVLAEVRLLDRRTGAIERRGPEACGFGYRDSAFKGSDRHVVLSVTFALRRSALGEPVRYAELAARLGIDVGARAPLGAVRDAVLALRRGKGMVVDPADPDTRSAGSFFTNPILDEEAFAELERRVASRLGRDVRPPRHPAGAGRWKTSAAWLIERAGFARGHARPGAAISSKHTLALTSRGGTTADLLALAHEVADGVEEAFGVALRPEPVLVGVAW